MIQESRVQDQPRTTAETPTRRPLMERERSGLDEYRPAGLARVTWGSVIAGTVAAIATQVLFAALGIAIGLSLPGAVGAEGIGIFAGIWWLITGLIALFIGGWVAGRFTGIASEMDATLHGVMTWALVTTLSVLFITTFGGMLAGGAVGAIADDIVVQQPQGMAAQQQPVMAQPGEELADTAVGAAWWTFFALLLGLIAAGIGGFIATPRDTSATSGLHGTSTHGGVATA